MISAREPIDIILPVYRDLAATERAIRAVLESENAAPWHLIVINDASPEPAMPELLSSLCASDDRVTLLTNDENLGFVRTVNRGLALHERRDVILLNSDTIVHGNWIDRMAAHADEYTASITPFSNNATICSTPRIGDTNPPFANPTLQTARTDAIHARVNAGQSVAIPVGVGFCMWMARSAIERIGVLDAEAFGRGYGEECDWCLRAEAKGFGHKLACDVFVYHEGGSSFGDDAIALKASSARILRSRYAHFEPDVSKWVKADMAAPFRLAALAEAIKSSGLHVILHLTHHLGGGTQKSIDELCAHFTHRAKHLILMPTAQGGVRLTSANPDDGIDVTTSLFSGLTIMQDLLCAFGVTRLHLHNLLGFNEPHLRQLVQGYGAPLDVSIHDYYTICPQVFLCAPDGAYCGEPDAAGCNACIAGRPNHGGQPIDEWRAHFGWWIDRAERVIAPSLDAAERIRRYHPNAPIIALPHLEPHHTQHYHLAPLQPNEPLRIVVIGALAKHKGSERLRALASAAASANIALDILHLGNVLDKTPPSQHGSVRFSSSGSYLESELPQRLAQANPHLVWFPARWPETYSYTLSQAMQHGAPLWVPPSGAFSERAANYDWTFWCDIDASPNELAQQLIAIRAQLEANAMPEKRPYTPPQGIMLGNLDTDYLVQVAPLASRPQSAANAPLRLGILLPDPAQPDACAFIRLLQPLAHPLIGGDIESIPLALHQAPHTELDALLVARTTIAAPQVIENLLQHAHERGIAVIYDLDDDLLNLPPSHPEYEHYQRLKAGVLHWLRRADRVTVSTQTLHNETAAYRNAQQTPPLIVPNTLDERLWLMPTAERLAQLHAEATPLKVVYVGTPTHQPDLAEILPALRPVLSRHNASLTLIGVHSAADCPRGCEAIDPPHAARASYAAFAQWLQAQQAEHGWQIGLAPLRDLTFNCGKSGIKFFEYSALGLAGIYADLPAYRDVITHQQTGLLAASGNAAAWASALETLLSDAALRHSIATNAANATAAQHTIAADATLLRTVLLGALSAKAQAPSNRAAPVTPAYKLFASALAAPKPSIWIKRLLRAAYHRHAAHPLVRRLWSWLPDARKQQVKQVLRRIKH